MSTVCVCHVVFIMMHLRKLYSFSLSPVCVCVCVCVCVYVHSGKSTPWRCVCIHSTHAH